MTNGVDTTIFYPDPSSDLIQSKGDKKAILIFSRSDMRKGFDIAKTVVSEMQGSMDGSFAVWIVGEPCESFAQGAAAQHFGYVDEGTLRKILSSSDVFLYPSRHEGFPLMALETLACGCPLVTTEAVNVVTNGVEALVSPVEDIESLKADLERLINDTGLANSLVAAGYGFVEKNTLQNSSKNFEAALVNLFGNATR